MGVYQEVRREETALAQLHIYRWVTLFPLLFQCFDTYPTGAPMSACRFMTPGHGAESTQANPYSIILEGSPTYYNNTSPIRSEYTVFVQSYMMPIKMNTA